MLSLCSQNEGLRPCRTSSSIHVLFRARRRRWAHNRGHPFISRNSLVASLPPVIHIFLFSPLRICSSFYSPTRSLHQSLNSVPTLWPLRMVLCKHLKPAPLLGSLPRRFWSYCVGQLFAESKSRPRKHTQLVKGRVGQHQKVVQKEIGIFTRGELSLWASLKESSDLKEENKYGKQLRDRLIQKLL